MLKKLYLAILALILASCSKPDKNTAVLTAFSNALVQNEDSEKILQDYASLEDVYKPYLVRVLDEFKDSIRTTDKTFRIYPYETALNKHIGKDIKGAMGGKAYFIVFDHGLVRPVLMDARNKITSLIVLSKGPKARYFLITGK